MDLINNNVNNIIFFKIRDKYKAELEDNEELYLNVQPLSYKKNDLSFLEGDNINNDPVKFYEDLGDFAYNANSLLFDEERKIWDDSISQPEQEILFNKLENIIDKKMRLPSQLDDIDNDFFLSDYFENLIKVGHEEYYSNWKALKEVKEKYGESSLVYNSFLEQWNNDKNKANVENNIIEVVKRKIKNVWNEKTEIKTKLDKNRKTIISKGFQYDIVGTTFNPKNFHVSDSEWTHFKISKKEINDLINANADEFKIQKEFNNNIESIEFDFCFLNIFRDWLHQSFLESRLWRSEDIIKTYPKKLMFIRNIKYTQQKTKNVEASNNNFLMNYFFSPVLLNTAIVKSTAHKAYLKRNASKKTNVQIVKKLTQNISNTAYLSKLNLGAYNLLTKPARVGRNPMTGKAINIKASRLNKQKTYRIYVYSSLKKSITNATIKVFFNGKETRVNIKRKSNIIAFTLKNKKGYSIEVSHNDFMTKTFEVVDSEFQKTPNAHKKVIHLEPKKTTETFALESDTFMLIGCIGRPIAKDNKPIKGIKYY